MSRRHHERRTDMHVYLDHGQLSPDQVAAEEAAVKHRLDTVHAALDHEDRLYVMANPIEWVEPPVVPLDALVEWAVI